MSCASCGRGFHDECLTDCQTCHPMLVQEKTLRRTVGRPVKEPQEMKDPESTGRKRAAWLYPINMKNPASCDWSGLKNCGGGLKPIVGCRDGKGVNRHHGPVKDTTRNEMGNVHRICPTCHNRWHELNDKIYDPVLYETLPHKAEPASELEILESEVFWKTRRFRGQ